MHEALRTPTPPRHRPPATSSTQLRNVDLSQSTACQKWVAVSIAVRRSALWLLRSSRACACTQVNTARGTRIDRRLRLGSSSISRLTSESYYRAPHRWVRLACGPADMEVVFEHLAARRACCGCTHTAVYLRDTQRSPAAVHEMDDLMHATVDAPTKHRFTVL